MDGLGEGEPGGIPDPGGFRVGAARRGDVDRVAAVPVHGLGLAAGRDGSGPEGRVVLRGDGPFGRGRVQPRVEHHEGVVPVHERVPEEGAGAGPVVPVADVAVLELDDEGFLVDGLEALEAGGVGFPDKKEGRRQGGGKQDDSFHGLDRLMMLR